MPPEPPRRKPYSTPALSMLGALLDVFPSIGRRSPTRGSDLGVDSVS